MPRPDRLSKQVVRSFRELMRRQPWELLELDAFFQMAVPTEEHPLLAVVSGRQGIEVGMTLTRGADGLARVLRTIFTNGAEGQTPPGIRDRWDHLSLGIEPLGSIPPDYRGFLDRADFRGRRETLAPMIYSKRPYGDTQPPSRQELRTIVWCLEGLFAAMDGDLLKVDSIARGRPLVRIDVSGSFSKPEVQARSVSWKEALGGNDRLTDLKIPGDVGPLTIAEPDDVPVDDPQTLEHWQLAEKQFIDLMSSQLEGSRGLNGPRAFRRYFGDDRGGKAVLSKLRHLGSHIAYIEWFAADYRATRRSKTWLEKLVADRSTAPVICAVARARCAAEHSIYRIDEVIPGASLVVEDVYSGRCFTLHDEQLSRASFQDLFVPLRLMRLGDWTFPLLAGPPFTAMQIGEAMSVLDRSGLPPTATGLRSHAELLGDLWAWYLLRGEQLPELRNTDADPLLWHTASFSVSSADDLLSALACRDDLICAESGDEWTWQREGQGSAMVGKNVSLCRLELIDDELVVEANSNRRLALAREWIERLPGVTFLGESITETIGEEATRPLDDRLPQPPAQPVPPEIAAEIKRLLEERLRSWIDEPIPALGGQTPRQACADPSGRCLVERLIRTMPVMSGPGASIAPPRQELLAELGLGGDSPS